MKYYKLLQDISKRKDIVCHYEDNLGMQEYDLCIGKEFVNWNNEFSFYYNSKEGNKSTDCLANDMGWFVVSEKLKKILDELNTTIQYFKINIIEDRSSKLLENYYVANIVKLVDALCLVKSDYFETEIEDVGTIYTVSKYAVYEEKVDGADIFKLPNHQEIPIFVSEKFKNIVEENKITGMEFMEIKVI